MPSTFQRITPFLWFDTQAEEAVAFYTSVFPNSSIDETLRYDSAGAKASGRPEGSVMTIEFKLDGQELVAINGGPHFKFNEALSLVINCQSQEEVDHYWNHLTQGGEAKAQQCGWLKDRFGLSWQVVPTELTQLLKHPDPEKARRVMAAMLQMKKIDLAELRKAAA